MATRLTLKVADLSAQSLISLHLLQHFPHDPIVGEEDTTELRANAGLRERVIALVNGSFEQEEGWAKGQKFSEEEQVSSS
jgi:3'(2'), 5'-bisphosphate nucleotidase